VDILNIDLGPFSCKWTTLVIFAREKSCPSCGVTVLVICSLIFGVGVAVLVAVDVAEGIVVRVTFCEGSGDFVGTEIRVVPNFSCANSDSVSDNL
jgi:hypothetical protein